MINTEELTMSERSELIEVRAEQFYTALKSVTRSSDGAIDSQAFAKAMVRLETEGSAIGVIPYLAIATHEVLENAAPLTGLNAAYGRVETRAFELLHEACDLFRVLNPHAF